WRILRFPLSESTLNFRIFLFNRTGCLCEVIHIRRVDGAHYRESSQEDKWKNAFLFQLLIF
ncbi:hypothetical protein ACEA16_22420, partial [Escherichia coli]